MQSRGKTAAGTQRWLCVACRTSHALGHETQKKGRVLDRFVAHLLGNLSQAKLGLPARTWRSQTEWCWEIPVPTPQSSSEAHLVVLIDGTWVGGIVCLITRTPAHVLSWRWAGWESSSTWDILLATAPEPLVVVCDGQKGMLLSLARYWPNTHIQRCLFHVWLNMKTKLTLHPQTEAGQELLKLYREIWDVRNHEQATLWQGQFQACYDKYDTFLRQRTLNSNPQPGQRKWWYTHRDVRSAYRQIEALLKENQLFTYADVQLLERTGQAIPRTTNYVEGGTNSPLKDLLRAHRGMTQTHQQKLAEWYLYGKTEEAKPPRNCL